MSVCLNDTKEDLRITKINNWMNCIQDQVKWKEVLSRSELSNNEVVLPDEEARLRVKSLKFLFNVLGTCVSRLSML